jgi:hypothetical protein
MTKKDYELFARYLNQAKNAMIARPFEFGEVVDLVSQVFKYDNSNFKQDKFSEACYEGKHIRKSIASD